MNDTLDIAVMTCSRLGLAIVLAGLLGLERERKGRGAGLRTHVLVCLGSTLAMILADLLAREQAILHPGLIPDRGRLAAGVITGVGFLGAGTILKVGHIRRGLTTAAMIWFVSALGCAIGAGFYLTSICAALAALLVVMSLEALSNLVPAEEHLVLRLRLPGGPEAAARVAAYTRAQGFRVMTSRIRVDSEGAADLVFELTARARPVLAELASDLQREFPAAERLELER